MSDIPNLENIKVTAIAAMDKNGVIGADGDLPWRLPDDLKTFKRLSIHRPLIMGRKTFESIGRPLPKRTNIVLTRSRSFQAEGCYIAHTVAEAFSIAIAHIATAHSVEHQEIIIGGGAVIYNLFLPHLTHMHLTQVDCEVKGDTWFPEWEKGQWAVIESGRHSADERHAFSFNTTLYKRIT
ncbi:MAG: dihydrofolate reductase [Cellvibrionaceae bacterium]|jgi:dihydrofolate reductase